MRSPTALFLIVAAFGLAACEGHRSKNVDWNALDSLEDHRETTPGAVSGDDGWISIIPD